MVPSDCSQVRRALRSAHAAAAGGQDRRAAALSTGTGLLAAAIAADREAASGPRGGGSIAARPVAGTPVAGIPVAGIPVGARPVAGILVADIASGADTTPDTAVTGRRTPCQPAAVVTATTRIARTASQSVRRRPRAYIRQRPSHTGSMLSAPAAARPAGRGVDGQPISSPRHGTNLSDRTRASGRLAGKAACYETVAVGTVAPGARPAGQAVRQTVSRPAGQAVRQSDRQADDYLVGPSMRSSTPSRMRSRPKMNSSSGPSSASKTPAAMNAVSAGNRCGSVSCLSMRG